MMYRCRIIIVGVLIASLQGCGEGGDTEDKNISLARLLKRNNTPETRAQMCDLLENDAGQRSWLVDSFEQLDGREQMGAIQAVCCVGTRNPFEEFHPIIAAAIEDQYMSPYAQLCLMNYDIPDRQTVLQERIAHEAEPGISIMFLRTYLQLYGTDGYDKDINAKLAAQAHEEHKAEIALALVRHGDERWRARAIGILKKLMSPPVNLYEHAPSVTSDVFKTLAEIACNGCDGLKDAAAHVAAKGREPARTSAQDYLEAFNLQ